VCDRHVRRERRWWHGFRVPGMPGLRRARTPGRDDSWAWLEPYPGPFTGPPAPSMSLAFVTALQQLQPDERAALVLTDVLDFGGGEVADILGCEPATVDDLVTRARTAVAGVLPRQPSGESDANIAAEPNEDAVAARFAGAFDRGDLPGIVTLLTDDARLRMRPLPVEYHGRRAARHFIAAVAFPGGPTRYRLVVTRANGQPAFGCYLRDPAAGIDRACGLVVLTVAGDRIAAIDRFVDNSALPRFGLPRTLPTAAGPAPCGPGP
jgi:Sigma-70, region 4